MTNEPNKKKPETPKDDLGENSLPDDLFPLDSLDDFLDNEDEIPDWLKMDLDGTTDAGDLPDWLQPPDSGGSDDLPAWLRTPTQNEPPKASDDFTDDFLAKLDEATQSSFADEGMPAIEDDILGELPDVDDGLSWLDEIAAGEGDALEELPTLAWPEADVDKSLLVEGIVEPDLTLPSAESEESSPLSWLDELDSGGLDGAELPDFEIDEFHDIDEGIGDWLDELGAKSGTPDLTIPEFSTPVSDVSLPKVTISDEIPEDPEAAMAWLEQLAARQGASLDELPTVDEVPELEPEMPSFIAGLVAKDAANKPGESGEEAKGKATQSKIADEIPEDPEAAMAWLEQLAARQGASLDELPTVDKVPTSEIVMPDSVAKLAESEQAEAFNDLDLKMEDGTEAFEMPAISSPQTEIAVDRVVSESGMEIEVPRDPDDAMAWLEQLAARQGASLDELPTVDEVPELEPEMPDVVAQMVADEAEIGEDDVVEMPAFSDDQPELEVAVPATIEPEIVVPDVVADNIVETEVELPDVEEADIADELPDDPEAVMAWLEKLAARQGAPLDELPTVDTVPTEDVVTPDVVTTMAAAELAKESEITASMEDVVSELTEEPDGAIFTDAAEDVLPDDPIQAMAWLESLVAPTAEKPAEPEIVEPEIVEAVEVEPESSLDQVEVFEIDSPELTGQTDTELAWLDELVEPEEIEDAPHSVVVEEPETQPSRVAEPVLEEIVEANVVEPVVAETTTVDSEILEIDGEAVDVVAELAWLDDLVDDDEPEVNVVAEVLEENAVEEVTVVAEEMPAEIDNNSAQTTFDLLGDAPDDPDAALDWLEKLALWDGAEEESSSDVLTAEVVNERPDVDELIAEVELVDETDLELAEPETVELEEIVPVKEIEIEPVNEEPTTAPIEIASEVEAVMPETQLSESIPEDPEAAMAWLEQLAARQGASLDELPTVDEVPTADIVTPDSVTAMADAETKAKITAIVPDVEGLKEDVAVQAEVSDSIPEDPEAAMAWLEQLAARQGASLDELPTVDEVPTADIVTPDSVTAMADAETKAIMEANVSDVDGVGTDVVLKSKFEDEIPEDPEAAMAWLEQLAARQGASLDELPTVDAVPTMDIEMPKSVAAMAKAEVEAPIKVSETSDDGLDWLEELAKRQDDPDNDLLLDSVADGDGSMDDFMSVLGGMDTDEVVAEMPALSDPDIVDLDDDGLIEDDELVDEILGRGVTGTLPDWLGMENAYSSETSEDEWLESLQDEGDVDWLGAEEDVARDTQYELETVQTGSLAIPNSGTHHPSDLAETDEPLERVSATDALDLDVSLLVEAREALAENDLDNALVCYDTLIGAGVNMPAIVTDLEIATVEYRRAPLLKRLLGDAYAQQGQLQKALDVYRDVLDRL